MSEWAVITFAIFIYCGISSLWITKCGYFDKCSRLVTSTT